MVIDMRKAVMRYYVGTQEPAAPVAESKIPDSLEPKIMAITNAMWQQRHSRGAGAIFRGKILYPMVDGMATLINYKDGSVDIQDWSPDIPIELVLDARQLRYLIVKNGMVVNQVVRKHDLEEAEIGLGFLLGKGGKNVDGKRFWFVAHRSAFGVREDGNLVFAIGHHIGTRDLAKCLVLAGCQRGMHADANPANIVGNLYLRDGAETFCDAPSCPRSSPSIRSCGMIGNIPKTSSVFFTDGLLMRPQSPSAAPNCLHTPRDNQPMNRSAITILSVSITLLLLVGPCAGVTVANAGKKDEARGGVRDRLPSGNPKSQHGRARSGSRAFY